MVGLDRVRVGLFAALGIAGCGDLVVGDEPGEGDESSGEMEPVCEAEAGESTVCIEPTDGACQVCTDASCLQIADDGSGCMVTDVRVTCGPMPANGMCCYTYQSGGEVCDGRPFVVNGVARTAEVVQREDWSSRLPAQGRTPWVQRGLDEHASIAAFAKFVLELLAVGAPAALVADATEAMRDEVEHARLCFGLAGAAVGPGPLSISGATPSDDLEAIAHATLVEGAVGETLAAIRAATEATRHPDPATVAVLEQIADDETRHAALAWRFIAWALERTPGMRARLRRTLDDALAAVGGAEREVIVSCWANAVRLNRRADGVEHPAGNARWG